MKNIKHYLKKLAKEGGAIVCAGDDEGEEFEAYGHEFTYLAPVKDSGDDEIGYDE